jgi:hypothetical protein
VGHRLFRIAHAGFFDPHRLASDVMSNPSDFDLTLEDEVLAVINGTTSQK